MAKTTTPKIDLLLALTLPSKSGTIINDKDFAIKTDEALQADIKEAYKANKQDKPSVAAENNTANKPKSGNK